MLPSHILRGVGRLRYRLFHQFVLISFALIVLVLWRVGTTTNLNFLEKAEPHPAPVADITVQTVQEEAQPTTAAPPVRKVLCQHKPLVNLSDSAGRGQTALVTGVGGFVGSHVATYCLNTLGLNVIGLDDLSSGKLKNVPDGVQFIRGSVGDTKLLHRLFASYKFDYIYHLAGHAGELISHHVRSFTYTNELVASANLLNAVVRAGGTKGFVYLSTTSVYTDSSLDSLDSSLEESGKLHVHTESSHTSPMSPLAIAKLAFEHDLRAAQRSYGLAYTILRAHSLYGPAQNLQDPYHSVISSFIRQHLNQQRTRPVTIYGDGTHSRAFTYVTDIVPLISMSPFLPAAENQIINVGNDEQTSINALKEMIGDALGRPRPATYVQSHSEPQTIKADHTKMRCIFGAWPMTSLQEGLSRLLPHVMASFSGKENIQSILDARQIHHVELADGIDVQSWEGHEVDVVNAMPLSDTERDRAQAGPWPAEDRT
ncbi:uncharacterized UDP-glucose epimerase YtcB-like [Sycon ciliatum]|uniref:uncharacterized UDP-glucose epimerase YtcB-like n=1 Tax=Sycon ciliatum TaxID=27933 RepID=UPI0031F64F09|eukprot:scpid49814/ scgid33158/ Uncharacterized UDP-glucose epimerase ytcB